MSSRPHAPRAGFSLLELVVVLLILSILGGLVLAVMPNLIKRTHLAKCSVTIPELSKTWMRSYAANVRYPDVLDSLLESGGSLSSTLPAGLTSQASADSPRLARKQHTSGAISRKRITSRPEAMAGSIWRRTSAAPTPAWITAAAPSSTAGSTPGGPIGGAPG